MNGLFQFIYKYFRNKLYIFISGSALFCGCLIYVFFRTTPPDLILLFSFPGAEEWISNVRQYSLNSNISLPKWIVFSLPNGLWAFAYSILISGIWWKSKSYLKYLWLTSIPVMVLGFEFLQYFEIIQGTFCLQDIALGSIGIIIGFILGIRLTKIKDYEKSMV